MIYQGKYALHSFTVNKMSLSFVYSVMDPVPVPPNPRPPSFPNVSLIYLKTHTTYTNNTIKHHYQSDHMYI